MDFWRSFSKVIFWISLVGCCISVLIFSFMQFEKDFLFGLIILVGGALVVMLLHCAFGMFLELCDNIADIRGEVYTIKKQLQSGGSEQGISNYSSAGTLSKLSSIKNNNPPLDFWRCSDCGTSNDRLASTCKGCGKYK